MYPKPIQKTDIKWQLVYKVLLPLSLLVWMLPLLSVALTSIRSAGDITAGNYWGFPNELSIVENYKSIFLDSEIGNFILNSFKITIPTVIGALAFSCLAGYALAVYRFKGNLLLFFMFIAGNFVPFQILMIPVRDLSVQFGFYDSISGLVFFHVAFQTGFCTFFMRNFIKALPYELIESSRMDGANEFKIFFLIVMPLVRPAISALAVLIFTFIWNDYFWATVLIQGNHAMPVTGGLKSLNGQWIAAWHLVSAGSIVAAFPPVIMFFLMQKHFISGLTFGATKG